MKLFKQLALTALLTIGAVGAVVYTSCTKDQCKGVTCNNGGTCSGGNCTCPVGFIGTNCQTRAFIGSWKGNDVCTPTGTYNNITITMANSSSDSTTVLINNAGGFSDNTYGTLSADGKTITYTAQIVNPSTTPDTLTGTFVLTDNTHYTHTYTAREASGSYSCSGNYTKQ
jgi:hypothetical protein